MPLRVKFAMMPATQSIQSVATQRGRSIDSRIYRTYGESL
jgi:hypothetical protein